VPNTPIPDRYGWKFFALTCPLVGAAMLWIMARGGVVLLMAVIMIVFLGALGLAFLFNLFGESAGFLTHHRRMARGQCLHCGYDLRASRDLCPECGNPVPVPARAVEALGHVAVESEADGEEPEPQDPQGQNL
jgi:hypothetical protein